MPTPETPRQREIIPLSYGPRSKQRHVTTGLYVRAHEGIRLRDKKVDRLARKLRAHAPWIADSDMPSARAWCEMEYLCGIAYAALMKHGVLDKNHNARRLYHDYRLMRQTQAVLGSQLGLTPTARMAIRASGTNEAIDLALQCAVDRQAEEARATSDVADTGPSVNDAADLRAGSREEAR
jgi:hypothetical protein